MANLLEQFLSDAEELPTDTELNTIRKLACDQKDWESRIAAIEADLEHAKESLRQIQEFLLPEAMLKVGMTEFKLNDGSKISIKDDVYASIRKDKISEAVNWLDSVGLGGIVKDKIDVNFGRGESEKAKALLEFCRQHGYNAYEALSVHPQTLKATVKEQLAHGISFPEEFFSTGPIRKSIIKSK